MSNILMAAIEKGVPIPPDRRGSGATGARSKYPWREMLVGDSFFTPCKLKSMESTIATGPHQRLSARFTAREEGAGTRVWRIS